MNNILTSKDNATKYIPSAYVCKKPPTKNNTIHDGQIVIQSVGLQCRNPLTVGYAKAKANGLSNSICKFRLTVGWDENTIASRISPASPDNVIRKASNTHVIHPLR